MEHKTCNKNANAKCYVLYDVCSMINNEYEIPSLQ